MSLYPKLAWRNIFRNKRRTYITGSALAIGLASLILLDAIYSGMADNMIGSATSSFPGEGQIHAKDFLRTQEVERTVSDLNGVVRRLRGESIIKGFTLRTLSQAMLTSPAEVSPAMLVGVQPELEREVSQVAGAITQGSFFAGEDPQNIVIGCRLAERLEAGLGDRLVVTVAQAGTGNLAQDLFRISGIYRFNVEELDSGLAFIRLSKAQIMLSLGEAVHEIALTFKDRKVSEDESNPFWSRYSMAGNEALGWTRLFPQLKSVYDLSRFGLLLVGAILFAVVSLGIINTLFMSIYERMFEFGVLRAVGTRPAAIRRLVVMEAGALALLSIVMGVALGFAVTLVISRTGLDYSGMEFAGTTMREPIYPVLKVMQFILYPACLFLFTLLVGLYPASYAARMSVAQAMKKTL